MGANLPGGKSKQAEGRVEHSERRPRTFNWAGSFDRHAQRLISGRVSRIDPAVKDGTVRGRALEANCQGCAAGFER